MPADLGIGHLFDRIPDAVVVGDARAGRIVLWNPGAERLFGYTAEEAVGERIELIVPDHLRSAHANGIARYGETRHGRMIDSGAPFEVPAIRRDGQEITVELSLSPLGTSDTPYVLAVIRDQTERRHLQDQREALLKNLQDERARLDAVIHQMPAGVIVAEVSTGRVLLTNRQAEQILGLPVSQAETVEAYSAIQVLHLDGRPYEPDERPLARVMQRGESIQGDELLIERPDGSRIVVRINATPVLDESGSAIATVVIISDITEQKRTADALEQRAAELASSNAELEKFAYVASHDLQEPLRVVVSYLQLLERRYGKQLDERADKYIDYAVDGARRMQQLINDLLTYSRVGRQGADFAPVDLEGVLERAIVNLRVAIDESGAVITREPLPTIEGDASQLVQLFQNLIANAIKFRGADPPSIRISVDRKETEWLFTASDNGIGIDPAYNDRIFVIFQRLHSRDDYLGTGIGLAICRKIVERHGGRIWVESEPGRGSNFHFTIPDADGGTS